MPPVELVGSAKSSRRASRSHSISSDKTSQTGYGGLLSPPLTVSPEAAFIAPSAASQIVTNDHDTQADTWLDQYGIEPSGETALVAPPALRLVNRFLDQLLFSFLAISKSTSLATLRPAVLEVLKSKLARAAISGAEQELHEYLGGGDDEDLLSFQDGVAQSNNWDLELVWKRTRLRCMVYSSLGDMEEEDEDYYTEQEQLDESSEAEKQSGVVSPAVAIFLTSILEYMGEQILIVAGQSAYNRLRAKLEKEDREGTSKHGDIADRVVVEEHDMERVAMDRTLGRIWRGWKKRVRSPNASISLPRSFSRESMFSQSPTATGPAPNDSIIMEETRGSSLDAVLAEYEYDAEYAAGVPLPLTENDVREIEIPGLALQSDDEDVGEDTEDESPLPTKRPKSLIFFSREQLVEPTGPDHEYLTIPASNPRARSNSLPSPAAPRYRPQQKTPQAKDGDAIEEVKTVDDGKVLSELQGGEAPAHAQDAIDPNGEHLKTKADVEDSDGSELDMPIQGARTNDYLDKSHDDSETGKSKVVAGAVAAAAVLGAASAVGAAATVKGDESKTELANDDLDAEDLVEDLTEEPQIMTSSRISIGGRRSPDDNNASTASSIRSPSIHSLRVIDVASPTRSRSGSIEAGDSANGRPNLSRSNSLRSPHLEQIVRVGSPVSRGTTSSPVQRSGSGLSIRQMRNGVEPSIMEEKEVVIAVPPSKGTPVLSKTPEPTQGVDSEPSVIREQSTQRNAKTAPFVLSSAPSTRQQRGPTSHPVDESNYSRPYTSARMTSTEHVAAPPLAPLREISENVPETTGEVHNHLQETSEQGMAGHSSHVSGSTQTPAKKDYVSPRGHITKTSPPRSSPPREDSRRPVEAFTKPLRQSHSGSTSSGNSHRLKPLRTSEDSVRATAEDKSQSFEQLMRSDQTIQYTLTPQNMRNIESPDSPRQVITPVLVSNGFDPRVPPRSQSRPSASKHLPFQSSSTSEQPRSPKLSKSPKPLQRVNSNSGTKPKQVAQPRDARIDRESVNDLAQVIRSTGPTNGQGGSSSKPVHSHRGTNGTPRNASGTVPRTAASTSLPRRAESSAGRSRLQARDAVVPRGDSISDLIDFVRSGPQLEKDTHRIPRTVAPFRSTMDSDQMVGAVGGKAVDATLPETRYSQTTSINSSVNSQSALINGSSKSRTIGQAQSQDFDDESMMPKRKTRRVRDPYAIDFSDEEDEELDLEPVPKPKAAREESLAEFLKNVPPPAESTVQPIFDIAPSKVKKKTSTHSFRSRFSRKESVPAIPSKPSTSSGAPDQPRRPTHTPIAAQFETSSTVNAAPRNGTYVSQVDGARKVAQKSYQPRDAVHASSRTNDLADFLMKSDPPPTQTQPQTFTPTLQKEEGTFQRMFGRKKVH